MEILIIILGFIPEIIYYSMKGNETMELSSNIMQMVISVGLPIISIVASVFVSTRSGNGKVTSAQKDLSKEHTEIKGALSKQYIKMEGNLSKQHTEIMGKFSKENAELKAKIDTLDHIISNEIVRKDNLSLNQSAINSAVDTIKFGWDKAVQENIELKEQVERLTKENAELKAEKERIQKELDTIRSTNRKRNRQR